jgi:molybdopterin-guanine dinucleotide biosynthesis adapter protein
MKGVQILGYKKSGKTALSVALLRRFRALGLSPSALKCTHNPGLDKEDTDTDRFLPHCRAVGALAGRESALFWNEIRPLADMVSHLASDVLVMEGGREHGVAPCILVLREPGEAASLSDPGLVLAVHGPVTAPGLPHVDSVEALADLVLARGFVLPGLDCGGCGRAGCGELGADILAGRAGLEACVAAHPGLRVSVGGRELALNPFVARVLASGIRGLLSELKGFGPGPVAIDMD